MAGGLPAAPLTGEDFAGLMARLGPQPSPPRLAVACSGGADSMALALLAADWVGRRGGRLVALTVDHGLRAASAAEAGQVSGWLGRRGIEHHVLTWHGEKPRSDVAATARAARYALLLDRCRDLGLCGLLLGHHQEDQAETLLLRLGRGSGVDGLSAMAPVSGATELRLLRPLLEVPRARLEAVLRQAGQPWIDDPSNHDPRFARTRMRALMPQLAAEGLTPGRLAATARRMARARTALETASGELMGRAMRMHPAGFCRIAVPALAAAPEEIGLRALAGALGAVGGSSLPPRLERLERLYAEITGAGGPARGRTLQGCRVLPWRGEVLVCREPAGIAPALPLAAGDRQVWDGRFEVTLLAGEGNFRVRALGDDGWRFVRPHVAAAEAAKIPGPVRPSLVSLWDLEGPRVVPHLQYGNSAPGPGFKADLRLRRPMPAADATVPLPDASGALC